MTLRNANSGREGYATARGEKVGLDTSAREKVEWNVKEWELWLAFISRVWNGLV
jgi:hypothetical protein